MLTGSDALVIAARCAHDDTLRQFRETTPGTHPELRRYREAGAIGAAMLTFPGDSDLSDDFFATDLLLNYSQAVVLEGDSPVRFVDLRVFVAPPPVEDQQLFIRCAHEQGRSTRGSTALEQLLRQPDGMVDVLGAIGGARLAQLGGEHRELLEEMRPRLGRVGFLMAGLDRPARVVADDRRGGVGSRFRSASSIRTCLTARLPATV